MNGGGRVARRRLLQDPSADDPADASQILEQSGAAAMPVLLALALAPFPGAGAPGGAPDLGEPETPPEPAAPRADMPDVVLVSIDTLRADRLGAYGRSPTITPEMDRVAAEGVLEPRLAAFLDGGEGDGPAELSPETLEALRALGYVQ